MVDAFARSGAPLHSPRTLFGYISAFTAAGTSPTPASTGDEGNSAHR